jgi:hypothetical protein
MSGLILLYLALSIPPSRLGVLLTFLVEAVVAFYVALRYASQKAAVICAAILAFVVLVPAGIRLAQGGISRQADASPAVTLSYVLIGLLLMAQGIALLGSLLRLRRAPASA